MKPSQYYSVQDATGKKVLMGPTSNLEEAQKFITKSGKKDLKLMATGIVSGTKSAPVVGWVEYKD